MHNGKYFNFQPHLVKIEPKPRPKRKKTVIHNFIFYVYVVTKQRATLVENSLSYSSIFGLYQLLMAL